MNFARKRQDQPLQSSSAINDMTPPAHHVHHTPPPKRRHIDWRTRTVRIELFIILLGCALLLIVVSIYLGLSNNTSNSEFSKVARDKYQAVFLTGGSSTSSYSYSTYFGHVTAINDKYLVLENVFYLTAGDKPSSSSQLTKLGCDQLHSPYDQMIINRGQVAYWENIRSDGQVVKAIGEYNKKFPNGPQCNSTTTPQSSTPSPVPSSSTPATNP